MIRIIAPMTSGPKAIRIAPNRSSQASAIMSGAARLSQPAGISGVGTPGPLADIVGGAGLDDLRGHPVVDDAGPAVRPGLAGVLVETLGVLAVDGSAPLTRNNGKNLALGGRPDRRVTPRQRSAGIPGLHSPGPLIVRLALFVPARSRRRRGARRGAQDNKSFVTEGPRRLVNNSSGAHKRHRSPARRFNRKRTCGPHQPKASRQPTGGP